MNNKKLFIIIVVLILTAILFFIYNSTIKFVENKDSIRCELEPEQGSCKALITKYYFNQKERVCEEFIWGGCDGVVPFDSLEECQKIC